MSSSLSLFTSFALSISASDAGIPRVNADTVTSNSIVTGVFTVAGAITILFILISAIRYIISQGNAGQVSQAKDGILYGIAGLVVVSLAFAIVQVVINVIRG